MNPIAKQRLQENGKAPERRHSGEIMDPVVDHDVRQLCKSVSEEQDPGRMKVLLDKLLQVLDERQLLTSLL